MQNPRQLKKFRPKTIFDVKKRLWSGVLVAIVSLLLASCTTTTNDGRPPTVTPPENDEAFASAVVTLINDARSEARTCQNDQDGPTDYAATHPLTQDDRLEQAALKHSRDMAENGFFAHRSPTDNTRVRDRIKATTYELSSTSNTGETLAYGSFAQDPTIAVNEWLDSDQRHCDAIMEPRYDEIGVGLAKNENGVPYLTAVFAKP